jgi:LPXTG-motif cell wall-anchored protein
METDVHMKDYIAYAVLINMGSIMFQKIALLAGIILIMMAAVLLIGNLDANVFPVFIGLLGIIVIGVFFLSKKKKWLVSKK